MGEDPTTRPRLQTISFEFISDSQLDTERPTRFLLECANSLLEWDVFIGIKKGSEASEPFALGLYNWRLML